jgi:hypothetical protein
MKTADLSTFIADERPIETSLGNVNFAPKIWSRISYHQYTQHTIVSGRKKHTLSHK